MAQYQKRARKQIEMGERIARERGLDRDECVDAAHWLIPDGDAARQGDDPVYVRKVLGEEDYRRAVEIERAAAVRWSPDQWGMIVSKLSALGPSRRGDLMRLEAHRTSGR